MGATRRAAAAARIRTVVRGRGEQRSSGGKEGGMQAAQRGAVQLRCDITSATRAPHSADARATPCAATAATQRRSLHRKPCAAATIATHIYGAPPPACHLSASPGSPGADVGPSVHHRLRSRSRALTLRSLAAAAPRAVLPAAAGYACSKPCGRACESVCVRACVRLHTHLNQYQYLHLHMRVCIHIIHMCVCRYICMHIQMFVWLQQV
jgi:hypothetical protein